MDGTEKIASLSFKKIKPQGMKSRRMLEEFPRKFVFD